MTTLVKFTDTTGKDIYVNPDQVCTVREFAKGVAVISFGSDQTASVKQEAAAVVTALTR